MAAVREFLDEANKFFGFYFDVGMACAMATQRIREIQAERGASDDSPFIVRNGPPARSPDEEIERSLHSTTLGSVKRRLEDNGFDLTQAAHATIISIYHLWDEKYRVALAAEVNKDPNDINVDILGDLRLLRHSLIHNKGIAAADVSRCKIVTRFQPGDLIALTTQDIYLIVQALRAELAQYV